MLAILGTCFMSFKNYPIDEQLCRVLSVAHANSIHEVVLRGSISYNTEFQRPLQYHLGLKKNQEKTLKLRFII